MPITTVTLSEGHGPGERSPSRIRSVWKSATRVPVAPRWRTLTRRVSSRAYSHATAILIGATSTATPAPARGRSAWVSVGLCPQTAMTETTTMLQDVTAGHRCRSAHARCMDAQSIVAAEDHANPGAEHAWWGHRGPRRGAQKRQATLRRSATVSPSGSMSTDSSRVMARSR